MHNPEKFEQPKMEMQGVVEEVKSLLMEAEERKMAPEDPYRILKAEQKKLNDREVIDRYFELEGKSEPDYMKEVKSLSKKIGDLSPGCELSIVIPAYREEKNILKTLEELRNSISLEKDQYEIILVNNYPEGVVPDKTQEIAEKFKKEQGWENLHILEKQFPKEIANVGSARKLGSDVVLLRHKERLRELPEKNVFYIAGTDADLFEIPKDHYPRMLEELKNQQLDAIAGHPRLASVDKLLPPDFFEKRPNLATFVKIKSAAYPSDVGDVGEKKKFEIIGQDFALSASAYARIGGIPRLRAGEDSAISNRATELNLKCDFLKSKHQIVASPRRILIDWRATLLGETWDPKRFVEGTEMIRKLEHLPLTEFIETIPDITKKEVVGVIKSRLIRSADWIIYSGENLYLDTSLKKAISLLKECLAIEGVRLPFDVDKAEKEMYNPLVKFTFYQLIQRDDLRWDKNERAHRDLETAEQQIEYSKSLISEKGETENASNNLSLFQLKKNEAELRIQILNLLEETPEDDFEKLYRTKLKKIE